jgi:uncharacterized membrane protein YozB (DUF420 family)
MQEISKYWHQTQRYHTLIFFVGGFLFDILTLEEVDDLFTLISQFTYLVVAIGIFLINSENLNLSNFLPKHPWAKKIAEFEEEIFHFALGALLNAFLLYFFKSSSFLNSLVIVSFLSILLWLNEFRPKFIKTDWVPGLLVHTCIISFFVILTPTLWGKVGMLPYTLGVLAYLSLMIIWLRFRKNKVLKKRQLLISSGLALFFMVLYITRIFPPVPLSLKTIGIYHNVEKITYENKTRYMTFSSSPWWSFWNQTSTPFIAQKNDAMYVFTRVFAPAGFLDTVYIEWWWRGNKGWMRTDRIPLQITGGRREGFRGFAYKENYTPGDWRVVVSTEDGLEIGRTTFELKKAPEGAGLSLHSEIR